MKNLWFLFLFLMISCAQNPSEPDIETVRNKVEKGSFREAKTTINIVLASDQLSEKERKAWKFELERMERIKKDFTQSEEEIWETVKYYASDLDRETFEEWLAKGWFQSRMINGEKRYFNRAATNVFHVYKEAQKYLTRAKSNFTEEAPLYRWHQHHGEVMASAQKSGKKSVQPRKARITYTLTVDADAVPDGETIKTWIPFPREIEGRQEDVRLVNSSPKNARVAPNEKLQRTVYLEKPAKKGKKTEFRVEYEYTSYARYVNIEPEKVVKLEDKAAFEPYLEQRLPHIHFTDTLKKLSEEIVGDETNPFRKARRIFEYVDRIPWAGAREYSTILNLADYAIQAGQADCGQVSMLLITLFRMNGIPVRWQSGWEFSPESFDTMHDWAMAYFEPYGWVPVDVTHGLLSGAPDEKGRWFYLGGMDSYRLIFNDDFSREFEPEKEYFRSETIDSQRGEVEWSGGNLYFDQWTYDMDWSFEPIKE